MLTYKVDSEIFNQDTCIIHHSKKPCHINIFQTACLPRRHIHILISKFYHLSLLKDPLVCCSYITTTIFILFLCIRYINLLCTISMYYFRIFVYLKLLLLCYIFYSKFRKPDPSLITALLDTGRFSKF